MTKQIYKYEICISHFCVLHLMNNFKLKRPTFNNQYVLKKKAVIFTVGVKTKFNN